MTRDEFIAAYADFAITAAEAAEFARSEGILSFDGRIEQEKVKERDIFEYGMSLAVDGTAPEIIDKILTNIIAQEKDGYTRTFKTIQKEAVLAIFAGYNSSIVLKLLNSYTDQPLKIEE